MKNKYKTDLLWALEYLDNVAEESGIYNNDAKAYAYKEQQVELLTKFIIDRI